MEYGTPSVTSTIGAEGMCGELPWNGVITDDPDAFAKAAVSLHEDKSSWLEAQTKGSDILQQCYAPDDFEPQLIEKIIRLKENLTAHRIQNFQGGMLKHHLMKSTKYMSLWIEEKSKPNG